MGNVGSKLMVFKPLRKRIIKAAHVRFLENTKKKIKIRIQTNFYRPEVQSDITSQFLSIMRCGPKELLLISLDQFCQPARKITDTSGLRWITQLDILNFQIIITETIAEVQGHNTVARVA